MIGCITAGVMSPFKPNVVNSFDYLVIAGGGAGGGSGGGGGGYPSAAGGGAGGYLAGTLAV